MQISLQRARVGACWALQSLLQPLNMQLKTCKYACPWQVVTGAPNVGLGMSVVFAVSNIEGSGGAAGRMPLHGHTALRLRSLAQQLPTSELSFETDRRFGGEAAIFSCVGAGSPRPKPQPQCLRLLARALPPCSRWAPPCRGVGSRSSAPAWRGWTRSACSAGKRGRGGEKGEAWNLGAACSALLRHSLSRPVWFGWGLPGWPGWEGAAHR